MERWNWDERRHVAPFRGQGFATLDPGTEGCLLVFPAGAERPLRCEQAGHVERCVLALRACNVGVLVLESQYVTNLARARSILELTLGMGIFIGFAARDLLGERRVDIFEVAPSTWQADQKRTYAPEAPRAKGFGAALAFQVAQDELGTSSDWRLASPGFKTGIASAWGMAQWWKKVSRVEP